MNKTILRETTQPITVDIETLSAMLSCGYATARKIGEQAGAKIVSAIQILEQENELQSMRKIYQNLEKKKNKLQ